MQYGGHSILKHRLQKTFQLIPCTFTMYNNTLHEKYQRTDYRMFIEFKLLSFHVELYNKIGTRNFKKNLPLDSVSIFEEVVMCNFDIIIRSISISIGVSSSVSLCLEGIHYHLISPEFDRRLKNIEKIHWLLEHMENRYFKFAA
jgi:hypothetical protein